MQKIEIIHETAGFLIVNKPAGLIVEKNPFEHPTVESLVEDYLSKYKKKPFVGIVHRLDRVTSGVMVFAKNKSTLRQLNETFRLKKTQKTYLALTSSPPPQNSGTLKHYLQKNQKEKRADVVKALTKGVAECILEYKVLEKEVDLYLLEIKPLSGKFHQIRVQLSAAGCPIIGDEKYGSVEKHLPLSICLHAQDLCFPDLETGELVCFEVGRPNVGIWTNV